MEIIWYINLYGDDFTKGEMTESQILEGTLENESK